MGPSISPLKNGVEYSSFKPQKKKKKKKSDFCVSLPLSGSHEKDHLGQVALGF